MFIVYHATLPVSSWNHPVVYIHVSSGPEKLEVISRRSCEAISPLLEAFCSSSGRCTMHHAVGWGEARPLGQSLPTAALVKGYGRQRLGKSRLANGKAEGGDSSMRPATLTGVSSPRACFASLRFGKQIVSPVHSPIPSAPDPCLPSLTSPSQITRLTRE